MTPGVHLASFSGKASFTLNAIILDNHVIHIDAAAWIEKASGFIHHKLDELQRDGILVSFSGGLDSSTVLLLCARAIGKERVKALLMPEKGGNPEALQYAILVADRFGIETITRDLTPALEKLGAYDFVLNRIPSRKMQEMAVKAYLHSARKNPYLEIKQGQGSELMRKGFARFNMKHRIRLATAYLVAEERNLLVAGCAHKSEDLVGLFVKFGVDDNADIMPLKNLYRAHILQIAEQLEVPREILERTPNPDIIPGISDKYLDILGMPSETLDLLLFGLEHGMSDADIASQLALPPVKVQEIRELVHLTEHMRKPSQAPPLDELG